jgi:hypothetical protein
VCALEEGQIMTHFKHSVTACVAAAFVTGATVLVAQGHGPIKGSTVTLTSCVEKAQNGEGDKFVLTHVADVPAQPATHGRVVYWIDQTDRLKSHVGHQIRLQGTVTDVDKAEMEVKLGADGKGGAVVEIEGHGTQVNTTPSRAGVSTASQTKREVDIPTTVVKLKIDKLEMVAESCKLK